MADVDSDVVDSGDIDRLTESLRYKDQLIEKLVAEREAISMSYEELFIHQASIYRSAMETMEEIAFAAAEPTLLSPEEAKALIKATFNNIRQAIDADMFIMNIER